MKNGLPWRRHRRRGGAPQLVKVRFELERDDIGYPPFDSEGLWAEPLGADRYRIDNTPWYARNLAVNDVVEASQDRNGVLWAAKVVHRSGNMTVRVIWDPVGPDAVLDSVLAAIMTVGADGEGDGKRLLAVNVPSGVALAPIKRLLRDGEVLGRWAWEEGHVSSEWLAL